MEWQETIVGGLRAALLPVGLLAPGALLLAAAGLPRTVATNFVASAALLFTVVVAFACLDIPLTGFALGAGLVTVSLTCLLVARRRAATAEPSTEGIDASWWRQLGPWGPLYAAIWAVLAVRLVSQPLSGPDVVFRWGWLPEQMLKLGTLDFYPPRRAEDFGHYFWAESIPPGLASLYAWARSCFPSPLGTSLVVALQIFALHECVWHVAARIGGREAARRSVLLAAATPLLNWSTVIGQETGLTALGAVGLALAFLVWRETKRARWVVLAGLAASIAAGAREYGISFAALGLVAFAMSRAARRSLVVFAVVGTLPALAWFVRTAALTGNPVYSLDFFGAAVNPLFHDYIAHTRAQHGHVLGSWAGWLELARHLASWALPAVAGIGAAAMLWRNGDARIRWLVWFALPAVVLWVSSLGFTAGGLFYSLRVLAPALALFTAIAGVAVGRARVITTIAVVAIALESLPKTLVLPENPYRTPPLEWLGAGDRLNREVAAAGRELRQALAARPTHARILTEGAGLQPLLAADGLVVVPLWSPEVAWLFDENLAPAEVARRWRVSDLRTVILTRGSIGADLLFRRARWRAPWFTLKETAAPGPYLILEITAAPLASDPP